MSSPQPHLQKFTGELKSDELIQFMVILYSITLSRDVMELNRLVRMISKVIGPEDFNKLVRRVIRMMGDTKCGEDLCSDWLMTQLYELYSAFGTEQVV
jgi:hypothetical protein